MGQTPFGLRFACGESVALLFVSTYGGWFYFGGPMADRMLITGNEAVAPQESPLKMLGGTDGL